MNLSDFLDGLIAKGYCSFTYTQAKKALGVSDIAARAALRRLKQKGELAIPLEGFYVIVPPEYRILGCRPAEHFVHELMQFINIPYYIGLLSAAQFYGAAHHRPQQLQLVINQKRRAITCGRVKIVFITRHNCEKIPTSRFDTSFGSVIVSSAEATGMDIVTYSHRCGGIENVLTVLTELVKKLDEHKLIRLVSNSDEITWVQRLGYLLDLIKANELSEALLKAIKNRRIRYRQLISSQKKSAALNRISTKLGKNKRPSQHKIKDHKWKLIINKKLEADL